MRFIQKILNSSLLTGAPIANRRQRGAQDSNDEPASVLLEKIKAEKDKLVAEKKGKKTKVYSIEEIPVKITAEKVVNYKKVKKY